MYGTSEIHLPRSCGTGIFAEYPARKLERPITREPDATLLEWSEYQQVLLKLKRRRDQLIVKVAAACAVRPEELFAFRWRHFASLPGGVRKALLVVDSVYREFRSDETKTVGSNDYVALPHRLAAELQEWRTETRYSADAEFIFSDSHGGFINKDNFLNRVLYPVRNELKLPKLNFQILRRTFATRAYGDRHGNLKDIQKHLRHTKPSTALENYIKDVPETVFQMVDDVYEDMLRPVTNTIQ